MSAAQPSIEERRRLHRLVGLGPEASAQGLLFFNGDSRRATIAPRRNEGARKT
jgi:hypothetical protein